MKKGAHLEVNLAEKEGYNRKMIIWSLGKISYFSKKLAFQRQEALEDALNTVIMLSRK